MRLALAFGVISVISTETSPSKSFCMNSVEKTMSGAQCRAARALIDWSREDLAAASKVSRAAIADFEQAKRQVRERTVDDLLAALEAAGVEFIPENGGGPGVRLRDATAAAGGHDQGNG